MQVGSRKILVASSPEQVVKLDDVTGAFPAEYAEVARGLEPGDPVETSPPDRAMP